MNTFLVLTLCFTAVFAAPAPQRFDFGSPGALLGSPSALWNAQSSILDDFEENLRRMREEFDQLDKALESGFKFPSVDLLENGTNIFDVDPSKVKNESFSDTKIVDGKVVHTEEKVISHGNSVVHFKKVEISPKDHPAQPSGDGEGADEPKKVSKKPVSYVPATSTSKNEIDTEHEDADADANSNSTRDVEEIDSVSASAGNIPSTAQSSKPEKQIYLV